MESCKQKTKRKMCAKKSIEILAKKSIEILELWFFRLIEISGSESDFSGSYNRRFDPFGSKTWQRGWTELGKEAILRSFGPLCDNFEFYNADICYYMGVPKFVNCFVFRIRTGAISIPFYYFLENLRIFLNAPRL